MESGFHFLDILIFAGVAIFLVMRLRSVLGKRIGHDQEAARRQMDERLRGKPTAPAPANDEKIVPLPGAKAAAPNDAPAQAAAETPAASPSPETPLESGLKQIAKADPSFAPGGFLNGARGAFEMIVGAFAAGDVATLRPLLAPDVYERFKGAIEQRKKANEKLETTLVGIRSAEILEAELRDRAATVTVKFVTEQVNVTRDAVGNVVDGSPTKVATVTDIWSFARDTRSRNPNWSLVATESQT